MTVWGPGGSATCQTQVVPQMYPPLYTQPPVYQAPPVYHAPIVHQPLPVQIPQRLAAAHVALTQIPYTGFGLGEFGTAIYWLSITIAALCGIAGLAYYRSDLFSVSALATKFGKNERLTECVPVLTFSPMRYLS